MKLSVVFWNNSSDASLINSLPEDIAQSIAIFETKDFTRVLEILDENPNVEMVITTLHPTDLQALFHIQQLQQRHPDVALVAIVDTMLRLSAVVHLLQRLMGQIDDAEGAGKRPGMHHLPNINPPPQHMQQNMQMPPQSMPPQRMMPDNMGWPIRGKDFNNMALRLTPRQLDVLYLIMHGKSNKEIARILELSEGTVKIHCMAIFKQLGVTNRTQAAMRAEQMFPKLRALQEKPSVAQPHATAQFFAHSSNYR